MTRLSANYHPGFEHVVVPNKYRHHPLVRDALFFTLPKPLLQTVS